MAIATSAEKNSLATKYGADATFAAAFTADPGTTGSATGEVTATGSPAYARKAISWGTAGAVGPAGAGTQPATAGVIYAQVIFDIPAGTTVTYVALATSGTQGAATLIDRVAVTSQTFATQGTYTVNLSFTET